MVLRKRPAICITLNDALLQEIDELAEAYKLTRSEMIERLILLGIPKFKEQNQKQDMYIERKKPSENLTEEYMKRVIFDYEKSEFYGWQQTA